MTVGEAVVTVDLVLKSASTEEPASVVGVTGSAEEVGSLSKLFSTEVVGSTVVVGSTGDSVVWVVVV